MAVWGIVVAAGRGARFGSAKQFTPLHGVPLVDRACEELARHCAGVVVALPPGHEWGGPSVAAAVEGGSTRSSSVRAALDVVPVDAEIVVVHDAARPLAGTALFEAVIAAVRAGADGAVPGIPVPDTLKRVERDRVVDTVAREGLVAVQTPQAFAADALRRAHTRGDDATDDAGLVERAGGTVVVVAGDPRNLKVTTRVDLEIAVHLLASIR